MKSFLFCLSVATVFLTLSCSESTGPNGVGVLPSTLSVTFTGSTDSPVSGQPESKSIDGGAGIEYCNSICRVRAFWTMCSDQTFDSYILYRSETPGIKEDPSSAELLTEITSQITTVYVDESVIWDRGYYYALRTTDTGDNEAWSNEAFIQTPVMEAPTPSQLSLEELSWFSIILSWTVCPEVNFDNYRLYRSEYPEIYQDTSLAELVLNSEWKQDTVYTDLSIEPSTVYYYSLLTTNTEGISSWSNEISLTTYDNIPDMVTESVPVGSSPWDAASLPDGSRIYVSSRGEDALYVIRTSDNTVTATVPVGDTPYGVCMHPSGEYVYAANWGSNDVSVVRTSDNTVVENVDVGDRPVGLCVLPSGDFLYVTNRNDGTVTAVRTSDNTPVDTVSVGLYPYSICPVPSGDYVYVANFGSGNLSVIRTADNEVVKTVELYANPIGLCVVPTGEFLYVSNYGSNVIAVVSTSDHTVTETLTSSNGPWGLGAHPTEGCIYLANSIDNTVSFIRAWDNVLINDMEQQVGLSPTSVCCTPDGDAVYVVNYGEGTVSVLE